MRFLATLLFLIVVSHSSASEWKTGSELQSIFTDANATGTFVLYDAGADKFIVYDRERAETRFTPASTFKIPNTLIGLAVGSVKDVDEILPYGSQAQTIKAWEKDMSLREAVKISNVPIYQELARRTGLEKMRAEVSRLDYGNGNIGTAVDTFWLEGPLAISAIEQTRFLARLALGELPFPQEAQVRTQEIVLIEQGEGWTLYAKTGSALRHPPYVGWWVGWVEKAGSVYSFALNIDITPKGDTSNLVVLGKLCLKALGVL